MTQTEQLYLQYYNSISQEMLKDTATFGVLITKLLEEFKVFGLTNEEKSKALAQVYSEEIKYIDSEASKAALALLQQEDATELNDAKIETEERKRRGYDDNVLIEIMKAQGGLASFAVNANSDTAQDTIDDLHIIMDKVEDRACDFVCDVPVFDITVETDVNTPVDIDIFGGSGMTYIIEEAPLSGTLVVSEDGVATYTPVDAGAYSAIIATEYTNGLRVRTRLSISVSTV
jgi:hypothetical protein